MATLHGNTPCQVPASRPSSNCVLMYRGGLAACVSCLQVSYSVIDRRPELFLSRFCEARGISLLAYGTLAGGFLAERFRELPADK